MEKAQWRATVRTYIQREVLPYAEKWETGIRTSAVRDGDDWIFNGSKTFIWTSGFDPAHVPGGDRYQRTRTSREGPGGDAATRRRRR